MAFVNGIKDEEFEDSQTFTEKRSRAIVKSKDRLRGMDPEFNRNRKTIRFRRSKVLVYKANFDEMCLAGNC